MVGLVREELDDLYLEHVRRSAEGDPAIGRKILVLRGPRGSGKTTQLQVLLRSLRAEGIPVAAVDLAKAGDGTTARGLTAELAWRWGQGRGGRRSDIPFPRLLAAGLAMSLDPRAVDVPRARRQLIAKWLEDRGSEARLRVLGSVAGTVLEGPAKITGLKLPLAAHLGSLLVLSARGVRMRRLPEELQWFAEPDLLDATGGDAKVALGTLCDLVKDSPDEAARVFLRALLADLHHGHSHQGSTSNAVLLIDNADLSLGPKFLVQLQAARRAMASRNPGRFVPLSVVVTSTADLVAAIEAEDGTPVHYRQFSLGPLGRREISVAAEKASGGAADLVAELVHGLTGGQPAVSTRLAGRDWARQEFDPDRVLTPQLGVTLRKTLLPQDMEDLETPAIEQLAECAVGRDRAAADFLAGNPLGTGRDRVSGYFAKAPLWSGIEPTLVRRLLLRELAARDTGAKSLWVKRHLQLVSRGTDVEYYLVGAGLFELATELLTDKLVDVTRPRSAKSMKEWLTGLDLAATAPRAIPLPARTPDGKARTPDGKDRTPDGKDRTPDGKDKTVDGKDGATGEEAKTALGQAWALRGPTPDGLKGLEKEFRARLGARLPQADDPVPLGLRTAVSDLLTAKAVAADPFSRVTRSGLHLLTSTAYAALRVELDGSRWHDDDELLQERERLHQTRSHRWEKLQKALRKPVPKDEDEDTRESVSV